MDERRFLAQAIQSGKRTEIELPFEPDEVWGKKDRHHITGTVAGHAVRGALDGRKMTLGAAWLRDHPLPDGEFEVVLRPEGPQVPADLAAALTDDLESLAFLNSLATYYRKGFIGWIEDAKREETRKARVAETVRLLKARARQR